MINQGNNVPDKTIAVFPYDGYSFDQMSHNIHSLSGVRKREWFDKHFYNCLPLTIGNQYGFVITSDFDFTFEWTGGNEPEDTMFYFEKPVEELNNSYPRIASHFGFGVITVNLPVILRTPPQINLMTINPPNFVLPNITVMTGVVESDNLRRNFTFNLKVQIPNLRVKILKGTPLAGFIPVPRYFCDKFVLENAQNIFSSEILQEEYEAHEAHKKHREEEEPKLVDKLGKFYRKGLDIFGNKFPDHQK
jgi:hypothetical protein